MRRVGLVVGVAAVIAAAVVSAARGPAAAADAVGSRQVAPAAAATGDRPFQLPVAGGVRRVFVRPPGPYAPGHRGVDLTAAAGSPVRAAGAGIVTFSGRVAGRPWLTIRHPGGLETTYGGLERAAPAGTLVGAGEVVGALGRAATHLDWGARSGGAYLDPLSLLGRWRVHLVAARDP